MRKKSSIVLNKPMQMAPDWYLRLSCLFVATLQKICFCEVLLFKAVMMP